ncbi:hypothetical protein QY890_04900 [Latilactobacillus sakei]
MKHVKLFSNVLPMKLQLFADGGEGGPGAGEGGTGGNGAVKVGKTQIQAKLLLPINRN